MVPREDPRRLTGWRRRLDIIATRPEDRNLAAAYDVVSNYVTLRPPVEPFFSWPNQQVSNAWANEVQLYLWTGHPHVRIGDPLLLRTLDVSPNGFEVARLLMAETRQRYEDRLTREAWQYFHRSEHWPPRHIQGVENLGREC